jgi:hypothetical protein
MTRVLLSALAVVMVAGCSFEEEVRRRCEGTPDHATCISVETAKQQQRQREWEAYLADQRRSRDY